jgi:hypothetical protein
MDFLGWFSNKERLQCPEDWYGINNQTILKNGGHTLLYIHNNSLERQYFYQNNPINKFLCALHRTLRSTYMEYNWEPWKFQNVPRNFVRHNEENYDRYMRWLADRLSIQNSEQWNEVSYYHLMRLKGMINT